MSDIDGEAVLANIRAEALLLLQAIDGALEVGVSQTRLMVELTTVLRESGLLGDVKLPFGLG